MTRTSSAVSFVQAFKVLGYEVLEASNDAEALNLLGSSNNAVNLIVTDIVMPVMGGQEFARRVRQQNKKIPILFISGFIQTLETAYTGNWI